MTDTTICKMQCSCELVKHDKHLRKTSVVMLSLHEQEVKA